MQNIIDATSQAELAVDEETADSQHQLKVKWINVLTSAPTTFRILTTESERFYASVQALVDTDVEAKSIARKPAQWAMEVVLMRMGVPEEYVQHQTTLAGLTRTSVITPFGVTEKFKRASGLPQGGTHSCALWNGFNDIMTEIQHEMAQEKGVMVEDEWGEEWELLTQLFVDDAHHCASGTNCVKER